MVKKKFIDKKKSATFSLVYREAADDDDEGPARVFTRVDGGLSHVPGFSEDDPRSQSGYGYGYGEGECDGEPVDGSSVFADAEEDTVSSGDEFDLQQVESTATRQRGLTACRTRGKGVALPDHVRRELVELGFPDDGYDYLQHVRKIGTAGVGAAFVPNNRVQLDRLRTDVKVYDASRVAVHAAAAEEDMRQVIKVVGSSTRPLNRPSYVEEGLDPEVAAALANSEESQYDSDDALEDDFVLQANGTAQGSTSQPTPGQTIGNPEPENENADWDLVEEQSNEDDVKSTVIADNVQQRPTRLLDEQFEMLALREYDDYVLGELDEDDPEARGHADISMYSSVLFLADSTIFGDKYKTPVEASTEAMCTVSPHTTAVGQNITIPSLSDDRDENGVLEFWVQNGEEDVQIKALSLGIPEDMKAALGSALLDEDLVIVEDEGEDECSMWDCETIVSSMSNLDNHPGKIPAPSRPRRNELTLERVLEGGEGKGGLIRLRGRQQLPLDFLLEKTGVAKSSGKAKFVNRNTGDAGEVAAELADRKVGSHVGESPEERKARKAGVKEERRKARAAKKALKVRYRGESQRAQLGAAHTLPPAIHLP